MDWPILLDACYFNIPTAVCTEYPSQVNITNILFQDFTGSSSGKEGKFVADLSCSEAAVCDNIKIKDMELTVGQTGVTGEIECNGIADGVGLPCVAA